MSIIATLKSLKVERQKLESRLKQINAAISTLGSLNGHTPKVGKNKMSASGRARIAAAQRARWARWKRAKKK
jgi:hypothetical protein